MRPTFYHLLELGAVERNFLTMPLPTVNRDLEFMRRPRRAGEEPQIRGPVGLRGA